MNINNGVPTPNGFMKHFFIDKFDCKDLFMGD